MKGVLASSLEAQSASASAIHLLLEALIDMLLIDQGFLETHHPVRMAKIKLWTPNNHLAMCNGTSGSDRKDGAGSDRKDEGVAGVLARSAGCLCLRHIPPPRSHCFVAYQHIHDFLCC